MTNDKIKALEIELEELEEEVPEGVSCSCHINPPCSFCIAQGNVDECQERIDKAIAEEKRFQADINSNRFM